MEFHWHKELTSTNDEAKKEASSGAPHGTLIGADYQTAGRGRSGKQWVCEPGDGLMCSVIIRPSWDKQYWGWVALLTGLVVSELLERDCLYPRIKYPNDVLVNGKKIAGVLTEAREDYVVVGIGMNLNMSNLPEVDSKMKPTSFYLETDCSLDVKSYAQTLQKGVSDLLTCESPLLFRREVEKRLAWKGEMISLRNKTESLEGVLSGLGGYGQLMLENVTGVREVSDAYEIRPLSNGK